MYPIDGEKRVSVDALRRLVQDIFERCAMSPEDAALLAETLVQADARGVHSHGVIRVPEYVAKLTTGGVDPRGRPWVAREEGASVVVDGGNSMGQIGARFAMERAIERAEKLGIGVAAVRGSNHCGAMAYYAMLALPRDQIGLATTNALPTMAPWGGRERLLGIDPLGVAIPAGAESPIVYDAAFSGSAHGKIRVFQQKGRPIPEGWALDRDGHPTTDPAKAIEGLLLPIGGFKGAGLALIFGLLSSMLSEAAYGTELGDMEHGPTPGRDGHFFLAIRISAFTNVARFKERIDRAIQELHACALAPGFDRVYAPGELEFLTERDHLQNGIPLNAATLSDLISVARRVGLDSSIVLD